MTAWSEGIGKISLKVDMDHYEDEFPETKNQNFSGLKNSIYNPECLMRLSYGKN
jgi:hypothetical protein